MNTKSHMRTIHTSDSYIRETYSNQLQINFMFIAIKCDYTRVSDVHICERMVHSGFNSNVIMHALSYWIHFQKHEPIEYTMRQAVLHYRIFPYLSFLFVSNFICDFMCRAISSQASSLITQGTNNSDLFCS